MPLKPPPLVSILIPAYNPGFFGIALASAIAQTFDRIEIVVCDDSSSGEIEDLVRRANNSRTRYVRNPRRLGFHGNFARCFEEARGHYIKFLNDDDVLHPSCVMQMVRAFEACNPPVALVTSRRLVIDGRGAVMGDVPPTVPLAARDTRFPGLRIGNYVMESSANFIGEPTTVMFRKADVELNGDTLFRIYERDYMCLADMCLWLRLLARGDAIYLAQPLSYFRIHAGQLQSSPEGDARCIVERLYLPMDARRLGFLSDENAFQGTIEYAVQLIRGRLEKAGNDPAARRLYDEALLAAPASARVR
jgi:glycosyltransferase involved in cell wall biosynthesis